MSFGISDVIQASQTDLHVFIRQDPIILKVKNPEYDGMKNYIPIWFAASVAGIVAGVIQSTGSLWFLINTCIEQEVNGKSISYLNLNYYMLQAKLFVKNTKPCFGFLLIIIHIIEFSQLDYKAKLWMMSQLLVSFILLTIFGGIFIAGFQPDDMVLSFGIDFIFVNIGILASMPIIRKEGKQPKLGDIRLLGGTSAFTALLML